MPAPNLSETDIGIGLRPLGTVERLSRRISGLFVSTEFARPARNIPGNSLHPRGSLSTGCSPWTRAIASAKRAGRWWWCEEDETRKYGLNLNSGRLARAGA